MKYYIPTTTLNVDNILSTESISPQASYAKRKFKPNYFERIPCIGYDNVILLFSEVPSYGLNEDEIEQYPIVIEFEDDQQMQDCALVFSSEDFSIYSCSHTIYLTPWNTHILVFDNNAYEHSKIIIESSRNCKIGSKFVWKNVDRSLPLEKMLSKIENVIASSKECDDALINIAKGTLWGHIVGLSRSKTPDAAKLLRIANEMRNIASSTISNGGVCKSVFYERLTSLNEEYIKIADSRAYEHWATECSLEETSILKKFNVLKEAILKFFRFNNYSISPELPSAQSDKNRWLSYRDELSSHTTAYVQSRSNFNLESIDFNLFESDNHVITIKGHDLTNEVLRLIFSGKINKELLRVDKVSAMKMILSDISLILRKKYGEESWDLIPEERKYINALGKNIIDIEPFDVNSINNNELISIAAYILKGEDFDSLVRYLEDNGIYDYDIALTLWGATEGYASIHKGLVTQFITPKVLNKINSFVGINSNGDYFPLQKSLISSVSYQSTKDYDEDFDVFMEAISKNCKGAKKDIDIYKELYKEYGISQLLLDAVKNDNRLNKGKVQSTVVKNIEKLLIPSSRPPKKKKQKKNINPSSLFPEMESNDTKASKSTIIPLLQPTLRSILTDNRWIPVCADMIFDDKTKKRFIVDMEWFVENHNEWYEDQKKGKQKGIYASYDKSNEKVIERLRTYMDNKLHPRNENMLWLAEIYRSMPIEKIVTYLQSIYVKS